MSRSGWVIGWAASGVSVRMQLNLWSVPGCLEHLIFRSLARRSAIDGSDYGEKRIAGVSRTLFGLCQGSGVGRRGRSSLAAYKGASAVSWASERPGHA
jgi:hypothetical protein